MKKLYALILLWAVCCTAQAQKSPYHIRNFKSSEYGGFNQTWQGLQDEHGLIHIASTSSIYTYDGIHWYNTPVRRGAAVRQIHFDSTSNTIYVGTVSDFGCLERDSSGLFVYRSFLDQLPPEQAIFTDIWAVHQIGNKIYFESTEHIFIVEDKKVIGTIDPMNKEGFALMFKCNNRLFVRHRNIGLMEIVDDKIVLVNNSEMFGTTRLLGILEWTGNSMLLLTGDQGFVRMTTDARGTNTFSFIPPGNDTFLTKTTVLGCEWIGKDEFAVHSRNGLMIYTRDFKPKALFNKATGLLDETISAFFLDRERNIWVLHNNGCSMISYYVPAVRYTSESGFTGTPEVMTFVGDTMFLGTTEGLYRSTDTFTPGGALRYTRVPWRQTEFWNILPDGNELLLSTSEGLSRYRNGKIEPVTNGYTNQCAWIDSGKTILTAEKGGCAILEKTDNEWKERIYFEIPGIELIRMSQPVKESDGGIRFAATTRFKTVIIGRCHLEDSMSSFREYGPENGLPQEDYYPVTFNDSIYFVNYSTAFRYLPEADRNDSSVCFAPAEDIWWKLYSGQLPVQHHAFNYRLFLEKRNSRYTTFFGNSGSTIYSRKVLLGDLFAEANVQFGHVKDDQLLWILNQQDIVQYNLATPIDTTVKFSALITNVVFAGDSTGLFFPDKEITLPYNRNSVIIRFAAPCFTYNMSVQFQYQLAGYDTAWSKSTKFTEKEYTNLPEGTYTFMVRAVNAFGVTAETAQFTFTILPPWYRSTWAYVLYTIVFFLLLYFTVKISERTLRKQKERLELVVSERTAEVVQQKQQIEAQKVDLEMAYTGIQDSIHYSQRIQQAILPTPEDVRKIVPDSFVLFYPRDIVSGDFYWLAERDERRFIACVDCTGHGVPGALMSMIGNTLLNQIILEKNITAPEEVLNSLHEGVRHALKQDAGGDTRDGMDIALISLNKNNTELRYAGANRNLWIVRNAQLIDIKANKFPIAGIQEDQRRFSGHTVPLQRGDCIYLSTDGYADQFGGPRGKKFMVRQLTNLLVGMHDLPMTEQRSILEHKFNEWRGHNEQVDDVLIIGIRID